MNKLQTFLTTKLLGLAESVPRSHSANDYEPDWYDYRPLTDSAVKGLNPIARDRQLDIVYSLFLKNGLAKRILEIRNDFIFGDGFKYTLSAPPALPKGEEKIKEAMEVLDEFWELNRMDLRFEKKGFDLSLNGMLVMPVFVNKINGSVKLGFVDPKNIDKVLTNPLNVEEIQSIKLKTSVIPAQAGISSSVTRSLKVIKPNEDINDINYGLLDGDCFYFAINNVSNQPEGVSDLLGSADWLDMLDRLLYNTLQFVNALSKYFQDVELTGADEKRIEEWKQKNPVSQNLSRFVHNEKVKYTILTPNINNADPSEIVRLYKNIVLGSQGFPEHWFADGGNTNLATAVEQGTPVMRQLKNRQQYIIYILQTMLRFALHKAYGRREGFTLTKEELNKININIIAPEFERKDFNKIGDGMKKIGDLLEQAERQNWLTKESSGKIFRSVLDMIGYDLPADNKM